MRTKTTQPHDWFSRRESGGELIETHPTVELAKAALEKAQAERGRMEARVVELRDAIAAIGPTPQSPADLRERRRLEDELAAVLPQLENATAEEAASEKHYNRAFDLATASAVVAVRKRGELCALHLESAALQGAPWLIELRRVLDLLTRLPLDTYSREPMVSDIVELMKPFTIFKLDAIRQYQKVRPRHRLKKTAA